MNEITISDLDKALAQGIITSREYDAMIEFARQTTKTEFDAAKILVR